MVTLDFRNAIAVGEKCLDQHDQRTAVGNPPHRLVQSQRDVMPMAASATAVAGKMDIHGDSPCDQRSSGSVRGLRPDVTV
jgi:hypothetical protein